ncbi:hypothetical protein Tco_1135316 [Tanacetum coccineum]
MVGRICNIKRGRDTKIPQSGGPPVKVGDEAVHNDLGDRMERAATTASSLEVEQDSVNTLGSREDSMKLMELMAHCTKLSELFWQTATASTLEDRDMGITATIDGKVKVVSEASIRRHLKLEDSDGISTLSTAEIFEQLTFMGIYIAPTLTQKLFSNMKRASKGYTGVDTPLFQTMLVQGQTLQGEGSTIPVESHYTPISAPLYLRFTHLCEDDGGSFPNRSGKIAQIDEDEGITLKSEGSEGFHQIVDFLTASHISTLKNGDIEITATIDGKVKVVFEASIRRHLKLEDSDGISTFPTLEIFEQLALMGSPTQTHVANEAASTGVDDRHGGAATTVSGLEARQGSDGVAVLENDLKQTKKTYGAAFTKLIKKVKNLEKTIKSSKARRRAQFVMIHHDAQTQERQEYDLEPNFKFTAPEEVYTAEPNISTTNVPVSTAGAEVSTAAESLVYIRRSAAKRKDKGKAIVEESEPT